MIKRFSFSKANVALVTAALLSISTENIWAGPGIDIVEVEETGKTTIKYNTGKQKTREGSKVLGGLLWKGASKSSTKGPKLVIDAKDTVVTRYTSVSASNNTSNNQSPPPPPPHNPFPGTGNILGDDRDLSETLARSILSAEKEKKERQEAEDHRIAMELQDAENLSLGLSISAEDYYN